MKLSAILHDFKNISEQYEVRQTLQLVVGKEDYRLEVLYCHSNPNARWVAEVSRGTPDGWKPITDFPWVMERSDEAAIRAALNFLQDQAN
jgi:hypothetical protein